MSTGSAKRKARADKARADVITVESGDESDSPVHVPRTRSVRQKRHWGAPALELAVLLEGAGFPASTHFTDPDTIRSLRILTKKIPDEGQFVSIINPRGNHWISICIDWDFRVFGCMGASCVPSVVTKFLLENKCSPRDLSDFVNISPTNFPDQDESECGARAALYAIWFGRDRIRGDVAVSGGLDTTQFLAEVAVQMEAWRVAR